MTLAPASSYRLLVSILPELIFTLKMALKALVLVAEGVEEMEAVIAIDVLRRAEVEVTVGSLANEDVVVCSRKVKIVPDVDLATAIQNGPYDAVIMPGGLQSATAMAKAEAVKNILSEQEKANRIIGAICAAPIALKAHGIGVGKNVTSYPALKDRMEGYSYSEACVVKDGNLVTSRGPGTAFEFALALVKELCGKDVRDKVAEAMLLD